MPEPIPTNFATIKVGKHATAIIDKCFEEEIGQYKWFIKTCHGCIYAVRKHKSARGESIVYMHRQITRCPRGFVVHHRNKKTLDNRLSNLQPCSKDQHRQLHQYGTEIPEIDLEPYRLRDAARHTSSKLTA